MGLQEVNDLRQINSLIDGDLARSFLKIKFRRRDDRDVEVQTLWPLVAKIHAESPGIDTVPFQKYLQRSATGRFLRLGQASQV